MRGSPFMQVAIEMDVSIVIVSWNTRDILRECLASLSAETRDVSFEVVVVDNASNDGSPDMVKCEFPEVILLENGENRGFAAANNQGITIARGRYVLLLNSDTIVIDNAIGKTVKYAGQHSDAAVVGCQVWGSRERIQTTCFRFPSVLNVFLQGTGLARAFKYNHFLGREWFLWWQRDSEREVDVIPGMFMLVRKEVIDEVGLMDESYFLSFEDTDWCYRFAKAGWKRLFWPSAKIIHVHKGGHSTKQDALRMFVQQQKSLLIFFKKHYGLISTLLVRTMMVFSFGGRYCVSTLILILRLIFGKNAKYESNKNREFWWGFKFAILGSEPAKKK